MFKKLIKVSGQNQLSGKDKKNLKIQILKSMSEQEVEHFFANNQKIITQKISGMKILIYSNEQDPLLVDSTGKGEYFPSLYLLNAYPGMLKSIIIKQGVEGFIFDGANLMWAGVQDISQLGDFKKNDLVSIKTLNGEIVAVGTMPLQKKQLNTQPKGIACYILHYLNDKLWELGSKMIPNVLLKKSATQISQNNKEAQKLPDARKQQQKEIKNQSKIQQKQKQSEIIKQNQQDQDSQVQNKMSPQQMDLLFKQALLNVLKLQAQNIIFPVDAGFFYSEYLKNATPIPDTLYIKNSSYKKMNKFYEAMDKQGLINYKAAKDNKKGQPTIQNINLNHQELKNHKCTIKKLQVKVVETSNENDIKNKLFLNDQTIVVQVFKPKSAIFFLFHQKPADLMKNEEYIHDPKKDKEAQQGYYSAKDIKQKLNKFINNTILANSTRRQKYININYQKYIFLKNLFKQEIQKHLVNYQKEREHLEMVEQPDRKPLQKNFITVTREYFQHKVFQSTDKFFELFDPISNTYEFTDKVRTSKIRLTAQKSHNKNITRIQGIENFIHKKYNIDQQIEVLSTYFQHKFACSVSLHDLPGKDNLKQIMVHGNFIDEIIHFLTVQYKIKPEYIIATNKLGKKHKK